jgi:DNA segregation ATPase FtsK/SpoIIIE-like protein
MPGNAGLVPVGAASQRWLPVGVDEHGGVFGWDFDAAPHGLVIGSTGAGKTTLIRSIVLAACAAGWTVVCLDPKRIELSGLRGWPGVRLVATRIEDMVTVMQLAAEEVDARYERIEAGTVDEDALPPLLIVLDEVTEFIERANEFWQDCGESGREHPVVRKWRTIARLGRSGKVHLLVGIQRPDSKVMGGESRDNFAFRVGLGPLSQEAARMLFGRSHVGRDVPQDAKGRATVAVGARDDATEVQCYWTPRIGRRGASGDERRYLDEVRAAGERAPHDALPGLTMGTVTAMGDALAAKKDGGGKKPASSSRRRRQAPARLSQEQPGLLAVKPDNE